MDMFSFAVQAIVLHFLVSYLELCRHALLLTRNGMRNISEIENDVEISTFSLLTPCMITNFPNFGELLGTMSSANFLLINICNIDEQVGGLLLLRNLISDGSTSVVNATPCFHLLRHRHLKQPCYHCQ